MKSQKPISKCEFPEGENWKVFHTYKNMTAVYEIVNWEIDCEFICVWNIILKRMSSSIILLLLINSYSLHICLYVSASQFKIAHKNNE